MARKKLSEMTPKERTEKILKGASWDEAEEAGIEILARCLALHIHARKDGDDYFKVLTKKIISRSFEWAKENSYVLAMAGCGQKLKEEGK